jgi:membrane fusion protein (multidrug efflux system)
MSAGFRKGIFVFCLCFSCISVTFAQDKKPQGLSPATVVVSNLRVGVIAPEVEYVGTVYYPEVSDVAAESNGRIETIYFDEGQRTKKGDLLVKITAELLEKKLQGTIASHEEVLIHLEKARADLSRIESLYQKKMVPEQLYDENRFKVQSLEKKASSLLAEVERLKIELQSKLIRAPFDGIVIKKWVDRGEWLQPGSTVATLARDDVVDVEVEVPEGTMKLIRLGMDVKVKTLGEETRGKISAIVPRADIATRTLPVKVRISNTSSLVEGMEARVSLPSMEPRKSLVAPRDAVITLFGTPVVFAVTGSKTKMIPVKVIGYQGSIVGIEGEGLSGGMKVVVKGNERLSDDQIVTVIPARK